MKKKPFYFSNDDVGYSIWYRTQNLRHQLIRWNIEHFGYDNEMPHQLWIVTLKWSRSIIPGLHFGEA